MASPYNYSSMASAARAYQRNRQRDRAKRTASQGSGSYGYTPSGLETSPRGQQYSSMLQRGLAYQRSQPGGGSTWWTQYAPEGAISEMIREPSRFAAASAEWNAPLGDAGIAPNLGAYGPGGGGGYGGGGGGGGPAGLDQATLDWILGQMGNGRPQDLTYNPIDLPDPAQYFGAYDTSQFDTARQGVKTGIDAILARGNTAFNTAQNEVSRFVNPYTAGGWAQNPDIARQMDAMARANDAVTSLQGVAGEGVQADQAFGNVNALMAANEARRNAADLRAIAGDRQMMEQNMGIEGNMLNLGVNMVQQRGQSAWDQMIKQAQLEAANQEAAQNWQRQNTVGDTNVTNRNAWNQNIMQTLLQLVGSAAPGVTLPPNFGGWA